MSHISFEQWRIMYFEKKETQEMCNELIQKVQK